MICNTCKTRSICKVYDILNNNSGIVAEIKFCEHNSMTRMTQATMPLTFTEEIENTQEAKPQERSSRAYQDITELSNKLKAEKEKARRKELEASRPKINILELEEERECKSCNTLTSSVHNCEICKSEMCLNCSTVTIDELGRAKNICNHCWITDAELKTKEQQEEQIEEVIEEEIVNE